MSFSFTLSLFLSILLLTATKLNLTNPLASILYFLTTPFQTPLTRTRQQKDQFTNFLFQTPSLLSENIKLKNENSLLKIKIITLSDLINDSESIKGLDSFWSGKAGSRSAGQIQPIRLVSLDNLITFTSRSFDSIAPGQPVVTGNSLIGLVKSVNPPIIKVIPLRNVGLKIPIRLETGTKGDYVYRANEPSVINLDSSTVFNPKTLVFTLPNEQVPSNLILGQIDKITSNPANPTQEATLKLDQEVNTSSNFFIITKP